MLWNRNQLFVIPDGPQTDVRGPPNYLRMAVNFREYAMFGRWSDREAPRRDYVAEHFKFHVS